MKPTIHFSFLPSFFTVLAVILAVAIGYRVHSYSVSGTMDAATQPEGARSSTELSTAVSTTVSSVDIGELTLKPNATAASPEAVRSEQRRNAEERRRLLLERALAQPIPSQQPITAPKSSTAGSVRPPTLVSVRPPMVRPTPVVRQPPPAPRPVEPVRSAGGEPHDDSPAKKPTSKDPTSDTTPPSLITLQFNPPVVHDGEESMVMVIVTDDISGVRNVSASISSPSGKALRAFPFQKDPETDQWLGKAQIPKDAEEGMWRVSFLSLSDNANNTANLTYASGGLPTTAVLRVISSGSDSTPPTLKSVWLDKRAISEGEHDTLFVEAADDKSGVSLVSGVFISPSKLARIGFGCRQQQGSIDVWECDVALPKCVDCGDWRLEQIQMQDKANNQAVFRQNDENVGPVSFNISGTSCDSSPPVLQALSISPAFVSNVQDSLVIITATITDNICGVQNASGAVAPPPNEKGQAPRVFFPMAALSDQPNTFQGKAIIPKSSAKGVWSVIWFQVSDKANNTRQYSAGDPVLANVKFGVQ